MVTSIWDREIEETIAKARRPRARRIRVDGKARTIVTPYPSPEDWRDVVIYFLMIDRFNNPGAPPRNLPHDAAYGGFQGGTLQGVREKLGYIRDLGATAVWLTPVFKNPAWHDGSYHGYGIQDFLAVDPRFGTDRDLRGLADEAHARGMYLILDVVLNHAGDLFEYAGYGGEAPFRPVPYETVSWRRKDGSANDRWTVLPGDLAPGDPDVSPDALVWPAELQDNRFFRRQGRSGPARGERIGDFGTLKEFVTEISETDPGRGYRFPVRDLLIRAFQHAIARYDVDGFRIDTLKHVEREFARVFGNSMREFAQQIGKKNFFTFGEVADEDAKIAEYTGRFASDPDDLMGVDAALDFPLFYRLPPVLKGMRNNPPRAIADFFEYRKDLHRGDKGKGAVLLSSHGEAGRYFVTFLDNHDRTERFYYPDPAAPGRYDDQLTMAVGVLFGLQGIPCLYYGTEQGLAGRGTKDLDVREALWGKEKAFNPKHPFYRAIREMASLRDARPELRYGRQYFREISGNGRDYGLSPYAPGVLAFSRILNDAEILVAANARTDGEFTGFAVVDFSLNPPGTEWSVLYSNAGSRGTAKVEEKPEGSVVVRRVGGGTGAGPVRVLPLSLKPMEVRFLGRRA